MSIESISDIYYNKGIICFKKWDLTTAKELFQKAILFNPNTSHYYNICGLCLYQLGEFNQARQLWEQSIRLTTGPDNLAFRYLKQLENSGFQNICHQYNKAYSYALDKKFKKVIDVITSNNLQAYNITKINNLYGLCHYAEGNKNKAIQIWQSVLKIDAKNPKALQYLSQIDIDENLKSSMRIMGWFKQLFKLNR